MKTTILLLAPAMLLTSCIALPSYQFAKTNDYRPDASIKLVAVNNENNIVLGKMEYALLNEGLTVISDHQIRASQPFEQMNVAASDTSHVLSRYQTVGLNLFPEQPADYVLRISYAPAPSLGKPKFADFTAAVVDVSSGQTVASSSFTQKPYAFGKRRAEKVLQDFARDLKE